MDDPFPEPRASRRGGSRRPPEGRGADRRGGGGGRGRQGGGGGGDRRDRGRRGGEGLDWLEAPRERPEDRPGERPDGSRDERPPEPPEPPRHDEPVAMFTPPPRVAPPPAAAQEPATPSRRSLRAQSAQPAPPTRRPVRPSEETTPMPRVDPSLDVDPDRGAGPGPADGRRRPGRPQPRPPAPEPPPRKRSHGIGLLVVALALVAWSLTCLVDVGSSAVAAAAALSPAITVLAIPVVAIGVGRRHPVPAALATLAAALPWVLVAGYGAAGPGPTSDQAGTPLRVIMVDANEGRADAARVAELARDYAADLVVVTELTDALAHDLTIGGLSIPAQYVGDGIGIWARDTLAKPAAVDALDNPAAAATLQLGKPQGDLTGIEPTGEVGILVAHGAARASFLPATSDLSELEKLGDHAPAVQRRIILGDLDATPWNPSFRRLASGEWRDAADVVGRGLRPTWPSWSPLPVSPLDHVLVSGGLGISGVDTANVAGTDHRALIVTVVVPAG